MMNISNLADNENITAEDIGRLIIYNDIHIFDTDRKG